MGAGASADGGDTFNFAADARVGVGLSYDVGGTSDIDLQAVAFDDKGACADAVFYNNLKGLGRGLTHSGDELGGKKGFDELIWAHLSKIKANIKLIVVVVAAYGSGTLKETSNGCLSLLNTSQSNVISTRKFDEGAAEVDIVGYLVRHDEDDEWTFQVLPSQVLHGRHFMDIMEPAIGEVVRSVIPTAPKLESPNFDMSKGDIVEMPLPPPTPTAKVGNSDETEEASAKSAAPVAPPKITVGLGWDKTNEVDMDVSAVTYTKDGTGFKEADACFFGNQTIPGFEHLGDCQEGGEGGDDEVIEVDPMAVPADVVQIVFIINIASKDKQFDLVKNAYIRVCQDAKQLCKFTVGGNSAVEANPDSVIDVPLSKEGLIIARFVREENAPRWMFQACPEAVMGRTYKDSRESLQKFIAVTPKEYAETAKASDNEPDNAPP